MTLIVSTPAPETGLEPLLARSPAPLCDLPPLPATRAPALAPELAPDEAVLAREGARALVDAGFMPLDHYIELARQRCWLPAGEMPAPQAPQCGKSPATTP